MQGLSLGHKLGRDQCEEENIMRQLVKYKSLLHEMTQTTPTCLWNDSASIQELTYSLDHGAVGATCNPVIVGEVLKKEMPLWKDRIHELIEEMPFATEDQIAWKGWRKFQSKGPNSSNLSLNSFGESTGAFPSKRILAFIGIRRLFSRRHYTSTVWRRTSSSRFL
jgi:hypothetical protein